MAENGPDAGRADSGTSYTFTCGKIDAGIAVLIGAHAHLIEFPSLLLPPGCEPGSIVNITCARNLTAEKEQAKAFWDLQESILARFGTESPSPPELRLRGVTQTSVTLEWDPLKLAQAKLLGLALYRNGQRVSAIPNPAHNLSTKLSGLDLDTEYKFHLVLKTTAGTYNSKTIAVRTHSLSDTSGINVCIGHISPPELLAEVTESVTADLRGRWSDRIQIDTTHFVCTSSSSSSAARLGPTAGNPNVEYQRALQLSIPVVQPSWILACKQDQKMAPIGPHYLGVAGSSATQLVNSSGAVKPLASATAAPPPPTVQSPPAHAGASAAASKDKGEGQEPEEPEPVSVVIPTAAPPPRKEDDGPGTNE